MTLVVAKQWLCLDDGPASSSLCGGLLRVTLVAFRCSHNIGRSAVADAERHGMRDVTR